MRTKLLVSSFFLLISFSGFTQVHISGKYSNGNRVGTNDIFLLDEECTFYVEDMEGKKVNSTDCTWSLNYLTEDAIYQVERSINGTSEFHFHLDALKLESNLLKKIKFENDSSNYLSAQIKCNIENQVLTFPLYINILPSDPRIEIFYLKHFPEEDYFLLSLKIDNSERSDTYGLVERLFIGGRPDTSSRHITKEEAQDLLLYYYWVDEAEITIYGVNKYGLSKGFKFTLSDLMTSIETPEKNNQFTFYPNPVKDFLHIDCDLSVLQSIRIFNLSGEIVYLADNPKDAILDLSSLPSGVYLMSIQYADKSKMDYFKFIKIN